MDKDPFFIEYIFMAGVILFSVYQLYISKTMKGLEEEVDEKMKARPIANVIRYWMFLAFNSYFANMFFDIGWLLWISLFSMLALWILLIEHKFSFSYLISITIILLFFLGAGVPNHQDSFVNYISDSTDYECLSVECVKITEVVTEDILKTEIKILSIQGYSFDWYLLFAKGALTLKDEEGRIEEFEGINIGGLWLLDK